MTDFCDLPDDIIDARFEMTMLPIKTLFQLRLVSRSWCAFIDSPAFVNLHLKRAMESPKVMLRDLSEFLYTIGPQNIFSIIPKSVYKTVYEKHSGLHIWGSCNGVLCLTYDMGKSACLWNPTTREEKELPDTDAQDSNHCLCSFTVSYGFGFCSSANDYMVVKILSHDIRCDSQSEVHIYSLNTDTWTRIQDIPYRILANSCGEYVNGAFHWVATRISGLNDYKLVVAFDVGGETFREVAQPDHGNNDMDMIVAELGGKLCIVFSNRHCASGWLMGDHDAKAEAWVMEDYGTRESWRKLAMIIESSKLFSPLNYRKNGIIFVRRNWSWLGWYHPKTHVLHYVYMPSLRDCIEARSYVDSLVRLKAQ